MEPQEEGAAEGNDLHAAFYLPRSERWEYARNMFSKEVIEKYARVMVWGLGTSRRLGGGELKKGDIVMVSYEPGSATLAAAVQKTLLERGIHVLFKAIDTPDIERNFLTYAERDQLVFLTPWSEKMYSSLNGRIGLYAPQSLTHLEGVDPDKIALSYAPYKPLQEITKKREAAGLFSWTLCVMPTDVAAKAAGMSKAEYGKAIIKACYLDKKDPVAEWEKLFIRVEEIKKWLGAMGIKKLHVGSANTDLVLMLGADRKWLGVSGHNIPSFEIFTSPDWRGTEGTYYANVPSFMGGQQVRDMRFVFKKGEVVECSAQQGEEYLRRQTMIDAGAKRIGELSFTDKRFSPIRKYMADTLYDENVGGTYGNCHIAIGKSYLDTYGGKKRMTKKLQEELGFNNSIIHWDVINTEKKTVTATLANGKKKIIYENGMFTM